MDWKEIAAPNQYDWQTVSQFPEVSTNNVCLKTVFVEEVISELSDAKILWKVISFTVSGMNTLHLFW